MKLPVLEIQFTWLYKHTRGSCDAKVLIQSVLSLLLRALGPLCHNLCCYWQYQQKLFSPTFCLFLSNTIASAVSPTVELCVTKGASWA